MKILVVGSGGREHALAWRIAQTPGLQKVLVAPGNAGTARERELENLAITDIEALADYAQKEKIHLTLVGPEAPLAAGVVDEFRAHGLRIFGPTRAAAQLESSKAFSKDFMHRHGIPTAIYRTFTDAPAAHAFVDQMGAPVVVKADGLAAGKGVVVAMTLDEAGQVAEALVPAQSENAMPAINYLFQATLEATEEAILNSLFAAETLVGRDGQTRHALPVDLVLRLLERRS